MPVAELNNYYRITDLNVDHDKNGYYLTCKLIHCRNWVLCVSKGGPITRSDLHLTEEQLTQLVNGGAVELPELDCTLQGVSGNVFVGNPRYRNVRLKPPAYVQVWSMDADGRTLFVPDGADGQCVSVPMEYSFQVAGNLLKVNVGEPTGYRDGDLLYQVEKHRPIPLPADWINRQIPLCSTTGICVFPKTDVYSRYKKL